MYAPHPIDPFRHGLGAVGLRELADAVDVIEVFNARCLRASSNAMAARAALDLPAARAAASDAHTLWEIGRSVTEGPDFSDAPGLLRSLRAGRLRPRRAPAVVHLLSRYAALRHHRPFARP